MLDLFSGAGGFSEGFLRAGYDIKMHFYSEIDKHAIACYKHNFKNSEYVGSVTDVPGITDRVERFRADEPDCGLIITFGSPCQDFSLAGKRKGMDGERSSLITRAFEIISILRPDVFIWENVKGSFSSNSGADFWAIIQAFTDLRYDRFEWQLLNTAWLLPQNRERIYLVGHLGEGSGRNVFPIGEDDKIFSEPHREDECERERIQVQSSRNASCLSARLFKMGVDDNYIKVVGSVNSSQDGKVFSVDGHSQTLSAGHGNVPKIKVNSATNSGYEEATEGDSINLSQPNSETRRGRVGKGKAQTLETSCNQAVLLGAIKMERTEDGKKLRKDYESGNAKHGFNEHRKEVIREDGLSNTLDSSEKSRKIAINSSCNQAVMLPGRQTSMNGQREKPEGDPAFTLNCSQDTGVKTNGRIRRLTEIETERLQGFKDDHTKYGNYDGEVKEISRTQRYKLMGNAVTVDVVQMIAERL